VCVCVWVCVGVWVGGFCNVCVCVGFVMCGFFLNIYTCTLTEVFVNLTEVFLTLTEVFLTLTEVFPCFSLSSKANARVKLAKTGYG
jgi:hypothetical protein